MRISSSLGARFGSVYYSVSRPVAEFISRYEIVRVLVRVALVDLVVAALSWNQNWWSINSSRR